MFALFIFFISLRVRFIYRWRSSKRKDLAIEKYAAAKHKMIVKSTIWFSSSRNTRKNRDASAWRRKNNQIHTKPFRWTKKIAIASQTCLSWLGRNNKSKDKHEKLVNKEFTHEICAEAARLPLYMYERSASKMESLCQQRCAFLRSLWYQYYWFLCAGKSHHEYELNRICRWKTEQIFSYLFSVSLLCYFAYASNMCTYWH